MKQVKLFYSPRASKTVSLICKIGLDEYGIEFIPLKNGIVRAKLKKYYPNINYLPELRYGIDSMNGVFKVEQLKLFKEIIDNTLIKSEDEWDTLSNNEPVILKNPTRLICKKDVNWFGENGEVYRFIKDKDEWRVNYSFGKVNSILNKNITNQPFGKVDLTEWTVERDAKIRSVLIYVAKRVAEVVGEQFPDVKHFGLDIIMDRADGKMYLLELNRAHALNEEGVRFLLNGFVRILQN